MTTGKNVRWTGNKFIAVGTGVNRIIYSSDGINWYPSLNGNNIFSTCNNLGTVSDAIFYTPSKQLTLNQYGVSNTNTLDVISPEYFNSGYTNCTISFVSQTLL